MTDGEIKAILLGFQNGTIEHDDAMGAVECRTLTEFYALCAKFGVKPRLDFTERELAIVDLVVRDILNTRPKRRSRSRSRSVQ